MLLLESPVERQVLRNCIAEVLFQYFRVDHLCLYPSLFLSVIPTGLKTAILVDVGVTETRAIAVYDSRVLLTTLTTAPIGAHNLFQTEQSTERGVLFDSDVDEILRIAERSLLSGDVEQPDGLKQLVGSGIWAEDEFRGVSGVLLDCLLKCPMDVYPAVARHIVFSGGVSSVAGFTSEVTRVAVQNAMNLQRYSSLRALLQKHEAIADDPALTPEVVCFPPHLLAWVGGSLIASCKGLQSRFVRQTEVRRSIDNSIDMPDWMSSHAEDWRFLAPTLS